MSQSDNRDGGGELPGSFSPIIDWAKKMLLPSVIAHLIGVGFSVLTVYSLFIWQLGETTDQLDQRIARQQTALDNYEALASVDRREILQALSNTEVAVRESLDESSERFERLEGKIGLIEQALTEPEARLVVERQLPNYEEILRSTLPIGGPGLDPVDGFPFVWETIAITESIEELELKRGQLAESLRLSITGGLGRQLDGSRHMIEAVHAAYFDTGTREIRILIVAYVVENVDIDDAIAPR